MTNGQKWWMPPLSEFQILDSRWEDNHRTALSMWQLPLPVWATDLWAERDQDSVPTRPQHRTIQDLGYRQNGTGPVLRLTLYDPSGQANSEISNFAMDGTVHIWMDTEQLFLVVPANQNAWTIRRFCRMDL